MEPNPNHGPKLTEDDLQRMLSQAALVQRPVEEVMKPLRFEIHGDWHVKLVEREVISSLVALEMVEDVKILAISTPDRETLLLVTDDHRRALAKTILGDLEPEPA